MEVRQPNAKYLTNPAYRESEIGSIPGDWAVIKLASRASIQSGIAKNSSAMFRDPVSVPYLRVANVQDGYLDLDEVSLIDIERADLSRYAVLPGDVLMNEGGDLDKLGRGALWRGQINPCVHQNHVFVVRCKKGLVPEYLNAWTSTTQARRYFMLAGRQTTNLASINKTSLGELTVAVPPTEQEQREIAKAIDNADALIDSLEQLLTKRRQIKQGAMQELLTGNRRLPGFAGDWTCAPLGEIARIKTGSMNNQDKVEDGEFPFFVRSQSVERIDTYTHDCEAILIPGEGGIGSIFHYFHGRFALHQRVYGITDFSESVLGRFVYFFMRVFFGPHAMENSVKATVDSLRLPTFMTFEVRLPPTVAEQTAIVEVLSDLEVNIVALEERLTKARALKQAMAQALLTGRIRLVEPSA
ncbi:restriction endonuclease subunit S [Aquabacterium olei]|uniref:Restriction endonuclease subunit S n=1 Tax=Aquabacterium olei TaxID=1296669 RepID=A0A2U8FUP9_9BURK|nr:restriction endonuclease subunit S [Aquabacterium olei]AWI54801.1 restriction endonuclease subunit S [Aquabacterium olei]